MWLAVSCQPAPVKPERADDERTSADACPAGSASSDQCPDPNALNGTGGTGDPAIEPSNPNAVADPENTTTPTDPADVTTQPTTDDTGSATKSCLPMSMETYTADHLKLEMTAEESIDTPKGCLLKLVFIASSDRPKKTYTIKVQGREREVKCTNDKVDSEDCHYKLVTTFPSAVSNIGTRKHTDWYYKYGCPTCFENNGSTYTIKYLDIDRGNKIKIDYFFEVTADFDLDITIEGKPFVDGNGDPPRISKQR